MQTVERGQHECGKQSVTMGKDHCVSVLYYSSIEVFLMAIAIGSTECIALGYIDAQQ